MVSLPVKDEPVTESKRRFAICKKCSSSLDNAFKCKLFKKCCFGRWRAKLSSKCPDTPPKW